MPAIETPVTYRASGTSSPVSQLMADPVRGNLLIHVDVATIVSNMQNGAHDQVIMIRAIDDIENPKVAREIEWNGPSRFVHHDFMTIPGTKVQNWIETDVPIRCRRDHQGDSLVCALGQHEAVRPATIRGRFVIHIAAPVLINNRKEGRNDPVIAVRSAESDWANHVVFCRKVEWNGPTRMVHRPTTPIPGTNGRGVSFVETDAPLTLYVDGDPIVFNGWNDNLQVAA